MREPTNYAWHSEALAYFTAHGSLRGFPGIHEDKFHPGWFRRRLHSKGPWLPVCVSTEAPFDPDTGELTGDETFVCDVAGERRDIEEEWTYCVGQPISHDAYTIMLEVLFTGEFA